MTNLKFDTVLFDCDGVLVDSEAITNSVLQGMLKESGWALSPAECMHIFIGKAIKDQAVLIKAQTGKRIDEAWMLQFKERRDAGLRARLLPIDGALQAVATIHAQHADRIALRVRG
jgi:beta-phosphoglucomutase-like phosphatase (HAD superfamily)